MASPRLGVAPDTGTSLVAPEERPWADVRVAELLVGLSVPFWRFPLLPNMPGEIAVFVIVIVICAFVRPTVVTPGLQWPALLYAVMVAHVVAVSLAMGQEWVQRSFRFVLLFLFAAAIVQGRLHWRSVLVGGAISLMLVNAPAFYLGLTPDYYPPYLTGWIGDKNVAGMYYAAFGMLGLCLFARVWHKLVFGSVMFGLVWLTGSRTAIAAVAVGTLWWLLRDRIGLLPRLGVFGLGMWALVQFEERFSRIGVFADRESTDILRAQIREATAVKLDHTAWFGSGLNTAWVDVPGFPHMWFHDSYAALRVEGGIPMLVAMLVLVGGVCLGLLSRRPTVGPNLRGAEAALIVLLVCAWQLGEVFFTSLAFFIMGVALHERLGQPVEVDVDR